MTARTARPAVAWLLALLLLAAFSVVPRFASAQNNGGGTDDDDKEMADKGGTSDAGAKDDAGADDADADEGGDAKGKPSGKSGKSGKNAQADQEPQAKIYLLKSHKKAKLNGAEVMSVVLRDVFSKKTETMFVPNSDPKGREYDPIPEVAAAVESLEEGAPVEVEAVKEKGKWMVSSLARADIQPGEELETGYVFVGRDENEDRSGNKTDVVTLRKFGREVKVAVPMWKNKEYKDANWEPEPKIDSVLRRLEPGEVVDAKIKMGRPPQLVEIYAFRPPERGKFVGFKQVRVNGAEAAGFEMLAADGTTVTITLDGKLKASGDRKVLVPDPRVLSAVRKIKPDTEIIVLYREEGSAMILRDIKFPKAGADEAPAAEDKDKMKPEAGGDKPAAGEDDKKTDDKSGKEDSKKKG